MNTETKREDAPADGKPGYKAIEEMLVWADPEHRFPGPLGVDLDDVVFTMEIFRRELADLVAEHRDLGSDELRRRLHGLEIQLEQDLPMVIADVLPALKALRERLG